MIGMDDLRFHGVVPVVAIADARLAAPSSTPTRSAFHHAGEIGPLLDPLEWDADGLPE